MENEKMFDLMSKIYSELQENKKEMQEGFSSVNDRLDKVENTITNIEHNHGQKLEALFDGYTQNSQQLDSIDEKLDTLQKSVNDLGIRTLVTDNKLIDLSRKVR